MIGAYAIDASMVYSMNKYHEMYRAWVPLMDDEDPDDVGVQGYLKISIQVRAVLFIRDERWLWVSYMSKLSRASNVCPPSILSLLFLSLCKASH
jgi:hypothetical protein